MTSSSLKKVAPWTRRIIILNVIIAVIGYLFLASGRPNPFDAYFALRISDLLSGKLWELFTYMWVHADFFILHILFNMMTLYFVGKIVEPRLGSNKFLFLYLAGGVVSVGLFLVDVGVQGLLLGNPVNLNEPLVGASGAICAVLGVFSLMFPDVKVILMLIPAPIRAVRAVKGFALFSLAAMFLGWIPAVVHSSSVGWLFSVAHSAHLGGVLFGWWFFHNQKIRVQSIWNITPDPEDEIERMSEEEFQAELNSILDKISSQGIQSLTGRERRILEVGRQRFH